MSRHHAFVIEAEAEEGIEVAQAWAERELGMKVHPSTSLGAGGNPDVVVMKYGLLSVDDARRVSLLAAGKAFAGEHKVVITAASRAYHEAQNALLKLFEEPPAGTYLFLIMPTLGGLLPTLRSRVQVLKGTVPQLRSGRQEIANAAEQFLAATKEKRSALIKKLTSGKDEEERRENREEALAIVNGIEAVAYLSGRGTSRHREMLEEIQVLRGHLYDRSAPVRMILEHLSLVIPEGLRGKGKV